VTRNKFTKPARIDVRNARKIQENQELIFLNQRPKRLVQSHRGATDPDPAF